jgi:uncharacterized membrane protein YcaP (DUF421 family)
MRIMGKRQIGELDVSDLVTTLLLSEIAALPITDTNIPIAFAIIPMITLLTFEVISSYLLSRFPSLKVFFSTRPATLIDNGKLSRKEMLRSRISLDELISELRQKGISDLSEVKYAILEQNGKITVIQTAKSKTPSVSQLNIATDDTGIDHIVISDGVVNRHTVKLLGIDRSSVDNIMKEKRIKVRDVYLMTINDMGDTKIYTKEDV